MIQKIERLLDLMIAHYEKADNPVTRVVEETIEIEDGPAAIDAELRTRVPKARKPRTPKAEKAVDVIAAVAPRELTDAESAVKVIEVATAYVHRFKTAVPVDGKTAAIGYLKAAYAPADGISKLSHAQRVDFIAWLTAGIAAADGAVA